MVAQAEHIPVHLGAMPESVAAVIDARAAARATCSMLNDPYRGGTHLPDITLVSPIDARRRGRSATPCTRAHHSDVGGMRPGSMPADSTRDLPGGPDHPAGAARATSGARGDDLILANVRTPDVRRGDLRAQLAANRLGRAAPAAS